MLTLPSLMYTPFCNPSPEFSFAVLNDAVNDIGMQIGLLCALAILQPPPGIGVSRFGISKSELELSLSVSCDFELSSSTAKDARTPIFNARLSS